jgi:hypothetical protein
MRYNVRRKDKVDHLPKHHARKTYIEVETKKFLGVMWRKVANPGTFTLGKIPKLDRHYICDKSQFQAGIETPTDSGAL